MVTRSWIAVRRKKPSKIARGLIDHRHAPMCGPGEVEEDLVSSHMASWSTSINARSNELPNSRSNPHSEEWAHQGTALKRSVSLGPLFRVGSTLTSETSSYLPGTVVAWVV